MRLMTKKDWIIVGIITVIYSIVAFIQLGDTTAPQTFYTLEPNTPIILDVGEVLDIPKIMTYSGVPNETKLHVGTFETLGEAYDFTPNFSVEPISFNWVSVFKWEDHPINYDQKQGQYIVLFPEDQEIMLGEIGLIDNNNAPIPFTIIGDIAAELNDEQHLIPAFQSFMNSSYFDEVYYPRAGFEIINKINVFETTHPPLGKMFVAFCMWIFGVVPFAWRLPGTLAGIAMLPILYVLALKFFRKTRLATFVTVLFAADFMHFSLTRIATIDSYALLFILLMLNFMYDYFMMNLREAPFKETIKPLLWCGIAFGLGAASKWVCLYSGLGLAIMFAIKWLYELNEYNKTKNNRKKKDKEFWQRFGKTVAWCLLFFIVIPVVIYVASYLPQSYITRSDEGFINYVMRNQADMYNYHKGVTASHPYGSPWYSWLVNGKPMFSYINRSDYGAGMISTISIFGNPAVWWIGLMMLPVTVLLGFLKKDKRILFIMTAYLVQLLPWIPVSRVIFIYHYFPCVPPLILSMVYALDSFEEITKQKWILIAICALSVLLFAAFYPIISGMPAPETYLKGLKWFDSWVFF